MKRTPLKRKGRRSKSWRKQLWPEFSKLIRARDGRCLMNDGTMGGCGGVLTASHVYPKGAYPLLELLPLNCLTLCWRHHLHVWHKDVLKSWAWYERTIPQWWRVKLAHWRLHSLSRKTMDEATQRDEWKLYGLEGR